MGTVTFDPTVGGDGSTVTDDRDPSTGLAAGGFRTRLVPALAQFVAIAAWVKTKALEVLASASAASASAAAAIAAPGTSATSTTSVTIGTGTKVFTIQTGKALVVGAFVTVARTAAPSNAMYGQISAYDAGTGSLTIDVQTTAGSGTFTDWTVSLSGRPGPAGVAGSISATAFSYTFSTTTSDADPGAGNLRFNNGTQASSTQIYIDIADGSGGDLTSLIDALGAVQNAVKGHLYIRSQSNATDLLVFRIDSVTTASGYRKLVGAFIANSASNPLSNGELVQLSFISAGEAGYRLIPVAMGALDMDLSAGRFFTKTINGNSTFTFSNIPSGAVQWELELTHTSGSITLPASVKWDEDTAPTFTAGRTHQLLFTTINGGTRVRAAALTNFVN